MQLLVEGPQDHTHAAAADDVQHFVVSQPSQRIGPLRGGQEVEHRLRAAGLAGRQRLVQIGGRLVAGDPLFQRRRLKKAAQALLALEQGFHAAAQALVPAARAAQKLVPAGRVQQ